MLSSSSSSSYSSSSSSSSSSFHCLFFSLSLSPPRSTYIVPQHHTCPRFSSPSYPTPSCPAAIRHPRSISFASHSCLELSSARSALGFTTLFRTITLLKVEPCGPMAYSPSPRPAPAGNATQMGRHSATPPFPISKQKKRKNQLADRLNDISVSFAQNRDENYRKQLQSLQFDMNYIHRAQPYENSPLEDRGSDIIDGLSAATSNVNESLRSAMAGTRISDVDTLARAGIWSSKYSLEINDAMEDRDTQLTLVAERHNCKIDALKGDYEYATQVAIEENKRLMEQIRDRVIHQVNNKKAILLKEKHLINIGDTNALLLHPNQFGLGNPASPGGPQSNRKTRHTRHRLEVDDLGTIADGNKRKRKAPAENEAGSPGPAGRPSLVDATAAWRESQAKFEANLVIAPSMSIDELFTEKELNINLQYASQAAIEILASKRRKLNHGSQGSGTLSNADPTETEENAIDPGDGTSHSNPKNAAEPENDDVFLTAPEMDRTANSSFHATRSTRMMPLSVSLSSFLLPSDLAGRASAIPLIGTYAKERKMADEYQRAPPLSDQEKDADLAMMAAATRDVERNPGSINQNFLKDLCPPVVDYVTAAVMGRGSDVPISNMRTVIVAQPSIIKEAGNEGESRDE